MSGGTSIFIVSYNSTVNAGTLPFNNFTIGSGGGAGTTTLTGNLNVDGVLTIESSMTLSAGSNTINCAGNFTNSGTFTAGTSTVIFDGTTTLSGNTTFNHLTIAASSTLSVGATTTSLKGNFTNNGTFNRDTSTVVFNG